MGVLWWMEASLTLILISPCIFIMAPRVTPARCMKCPASCHPRPLSFYLCNSSLLPSLLLSFPSVLSLFHSHLFGSFRRHKCLFSPHKHDLLLQPRRGCAFFFPFSESVMFTLSVLLLFLVPGFLLFSQIIPFCKKLKYRDNDLEIGMQVNLCPKKHPASHVSTPALPC